MEYKTLKGAVRAALFSALLLTLLLALFSCGEKEHKIEVEGIPLKSEVLTPYSDATRTDAEALMHTLLSHYYTASGKEAPDQEVIAARAVSLRAISEIHLLPEKSYRALLSFLREEGAALIDRTLAILEGDGSLSELKRSYLTLTSTVGEEYLGDLVHALVLFTYDVKYENAMALYEASGSVSQKVKAQEYLKERAVFTQNVDEADTRVLLSTVLFFADLLAGNAFSEGSATLFSDEEILLFIRHVDLTDLTVGRDGWLLLFDHAATAIGQMKNAPYIAKLFFSCIKNTNYESGKTDGEALADRMQAILSLLISAQARLESEDVLLMRSGDGVALFERVLSRMNAEERASFLALADYTPYRAAYESVAKNAYPDTYEAYAESVTVYTAEQLLLAVGTVQFAEVLEGFLAHYSPAFSILLNGADV